MHTHRLLRFRGGSVVGDEPLQRGLGGGEVVRGEGGAPPFES